MIDLRSDTVTQPTPEMRAVMAAAPVGDDQFGEDPTANLLQERLAAMLGKEAALWVPSGTMANQVALRVLTRPGDDVIVSRDSHAVLHETGGAAANSGVQFTAIGERGRFTADQLRAAIKPRDHIILPPTTLVEVENTHNRAGGVVVPAVETTRICEAASEAGVGTYLDGARLWHAAAAEGRPLEDYAAPFDLVAVAFSKGLGAPGGSALAGSQEIIHRAVRHRRMLGGAMRQIGVFAAAALYALDHNLSRLSDDHVKARRLAERIAESSNVEVDLGLVETNIVMFELDAGSVDAPALVAQALDRGVQLIAFGPRTVRAVTHMDVTDAECADAADIILEIAHG